MMRKISLLTLSFTTVGERIHPHFLSWERPEVKKLENFAIPRKMTCDQILFNPAPPPPPKKMHYYAWFAHGCPPLLWVDSPTPVRVMLCRNRKAVSDSVKQKHVIFLQPSSLPIGWNICNLYVISTAVKYGTYSNNTGYKASWFCHICNHHW